MPVERKILIHFLLKGLFLKTLPKSQFSILKKVVVLANLDLIFPFLEFTEC